MNAPEIINPAHLILQHADDAMSATDVARKLYATDKPTKLQILDAGKKLKALGALGLIEMEPRAGGVPFYRLIVAPEVVTISPDAAQIDKPTPKTTATALTDAQREEFTLLGVLADIRAAIGDDSRIMLGDLAAHIGKRCKERNDLRTHLSHIACVCADYLPDPSDSTTVRAVEIMDLLIDAQHAHIQHLSTELAGSELCRDSLRADALRLDAWRKAGEIIGADSPGELIDVVRAAENEAESLRGKLFTAQQAHAALRDPLDREDANSHAGLQRTIQELRDRAVEQAEQYKADIARMAAEIDALRADNEALMRDPVGYLVRAAKRQPRTFASIEAAREAALAAIRAGAQRAEVCPMLAPVGVARKGAEWRAA